MNDLVGYLVLASHSANVAQELAAEKGVSRYLNAVICHLARKLFQSSALSSSLVGWMQKTKSISTVRHRCRGWWRGDRRVASRTGDLVRWPRWCLPIPPRRLLCTGLAMNWRDFIALASRLAGGTTEAEWRTAVSRAYYTAFP